MELPRIRKDVMLQRNRCMTGNSLANIYTDSRIQEAISAQLSYVPNTNSSYNTKTERLLFKSKALDNSRVEPLP